MGKPLAITRTEHAAADLRAFAAKSRDGAQVRRLLALAFILDGHSRTEAAERAGMERQTLRDWVHRYNAEGIAGLRSSHGPGKPPLLTAAQMAELKATVLKGPDPEKHGVVRWRCVDLREEVARRFTVEVTDRTIGKWLRKLDLPRLQPRPFHPKKDEAAQSALKKLMWTAEGKQDFLVRRSAEAAPMFVAADVGNPGAGDGQSRPNPRGGSIACSSARSKSQITCNASASRPSCRLGGSASSQAAYCACKSASSATASCQRRARPRWSAGRRVRITGASAARAAR